MLNLQDASCFLMEEMIFFHDYSMFFLVFILSMVIFILTSMAASKGVNRFLLFNESVEFLWIVLPTFILVFIALPSMKVLYLSDVSMNPDMTMKVIGHQWYWSYFYPEFNDEELNSFCKIEIEKSEYRSLDTDIHVALPLKKKVRVVTTSEDVIHSWTIPVLGVKMDSIPGRLNQLLIESEAAGLFFGQCSEICGILHSFMPVNMEVVNVGNFLSWILSKNE